MPKLLETNSFTTVITQVKRVDRFGKSYKCLVGAEELNHFLGTLKAKGWKTKGFGIYFNKTKTVEITLNNLTNLCHDHGFQCIDVDT